MDNFDNFVSAFIAICLLIIGFLLGAGHADGGWIRDCLSKGGHSSGHFIYVCQQLK